MQWYQQFLLPLVLAIAAVASFTVPYLYQWTISRRRNFATRILFDFVHIYYRLVNAKEDDKDPIVKPGMMGYKL
jgi:hypothetical protein